MERINSYFLRNSVAIGSCIDGEFDIEYTHIWQPSGGATDFFETDDPDTWYWPKGPLYHDGKLYVFLLELEPGNRVGVFNFKPINTDLAIVSNPEEHPVNWNIRYVRVSGEESGWPGAAVVNHEGYGYLFSTVDGLLGHFMPAILLRIPINELNTPSENLEYLTSDLTWEKGVDPYNAYIAVENASTEFSVHWSDDAAAWQLIISGNFLMGDPYVYQSFSDNIYGQWSTREQIHACNPPPGDTFCYAAKKTAGYDGFIAVCNSLSDEEITQNNLLYAPKVIDLPEIPAP